MINIVLRLRKANVKWLRNFYLINKYGIIREEILCIIHVFIYNTFNTNNTNNMHIHFYFTGSIHGFIIRLRKKDRM